MDSILSGKKAEEVSRFFSFFSKVKKCGAVFLLTIILTYHLPHTASAQDKTSTAVQMAKGKGINTEADIKKALAQRNMTEAQARTMAAAQGISYDEFVAKFAGGSSDALNASPTEPTSTGLLPPEPVVEDAENQPVEESVESAVVSAPEEIEEELSYFGYDIFDTAQPVRTYEPINPSYVITPGDELRVYLSGDILQQYELIVDGRGYINMPVGGLFLVAGTTYENLERKLKNFLSRYYAGLVSRPQRIFLDVTLTKTRPVQIYALGEVRKPGVHSATSFSDIFDAIYQIGGIKRSGSLRQVKLMRKNEVVSEIDFYEYLINGIVAPAENIRHSDRIFVPARLKTVSIDGEVKRPAIYELKDNEGLKDLVTFANGLLPTAYTYRVAISRIVPFDERSRLGSERKLVDVDFNKLQRTNGTFELYDGDEVFIEPINKVSRNVVTLQGAVWRPGKYQIENVPTLKDLISMADGLLPEAFLEKADLARENENGSFEYFSIDLNQYLDFRAPKKFELEPNDVVRIYNIYDLEPEMMVSISGYVKDSITAPWKANLTAYDLIFMAGGLQDPTYRSKAYTVRADLLRITASKKDREIIPFDLGAVLDQEDNFALQKGDEIRIYRDDLEEPLEKYVHVYGEVKTPGKYELTSEMTVKDLIILAKGFTKRGLQNQVLLDRENREDPEKLTDRVVIELDDLLTSAGELVLQDRDVITVVADPNIEELRTVTLKGEFSKPATYVLEDRSTYLSQIIEKAGGLTSEANTKALRFERNGENLAVDFDRLSSSNFGSSADVVLKNGDVINLLPKANAVFVNGEVNRETLLSYRKGKKVRDYIKEAGGTNWKLAENPNYKKSFHALYQRPNGMSHKVKLGFLGNNPTVDDGSVITVYPKPKKPKREKKGESVDVGRTITDVFAIVTSAVTIMVLSKNL